MGSSQSSVHETEPPKKQVFVWKIDGFTSLLEQGSDLISTPFEMHGISWIFSVDPKDGKSGDTSSEEHVSLFLDTFPSANCMLQTKLKFFIHDQKYGKHAECDVSHTYMRSSYRSGAACMVPLETLKNPSAGFLRTDTISVGVELIQFEKVPFYGLEMRTSIQKNMSIGSYRWCVDDFFQLIKRPTACSEPFKIAGYTWRLHLEQGGYFNKGCLSLFLTLDISKSQLPPPSGVLVEVVFSVKKSQSRGYEKSSRYNLTRNNPTLGLNLIRYEEFKDPANGYLIKGRCTFKVSISVLGCAKGHVSKELQDS
ncbi:hypothetical protein LUZ63_018884 [Rhynchospora breviuscula]|uniref:MATH domain-containing protein n=1 Tax=Rhynchospora breviuscula TaxID=2022672 RepID=A0A9Q0HIM1_9POAL|nr:hypothetical protein LUZ63_018884 [Rhynchospora breviuscula]